MYCIKCGVELSEGQTVCPLCGTKVYHPDIPVSDVSPTYPKKEFQSEEFNPRGVLFVITILTLLPLALPMIFELTWHSTVTWSGYVAGGVVLFYLICILPFWFKNANPVIFVPCDFAAVTVYLLYINLMTDGDWFLSFAFPITGVLGLIVTAIVTLGRYLRRGRLYLSGGGLIALGAWTILIEGLIYVTFGVRSPVFWSPFSFITLLLLGMMLIIVAIVKPLKESLRRIFFIG